MKLLALVLLCVISADAVFDADCDPIFAPGGSARLARGAEGREGCARFCIPDCFCCSRTLVAGPAVLPRGPELLTLITPFAAIPAPDPIRSVPYRPPLYLA
jgi:hypothetical protein